MNKAVRSSCSLFLCVGKCEINQDFCNLIPNFNCLVMTLENLLDPIILILGLAGLAFLIAGLVMKVLPPKKINSFYGYRTSTAMKNQETWDFTQKLGTTELLKWGTILLLVSPMAFVIDFSGTAELIAAVLFVLLVCVLMVVRIERKLKEEFGR